MSRQTRIRRLLDNLNQDLFEKEKVVGLALLSAVAGESIFLLGPPGVAKSLIARRLKFVFHDARSFEYLMGKFSTPDEVFGPVSISKLKDFDKYERLTENYLPGANVVFLDEIWKASPPIQNALLTVLNEKIYRNGDQEIKVDIRGLISASNELPLRGEGLEALWDRFLIRIVVGGIQDTELFNAMITLSGNSSYGDCVPTELKIRGEEYEEWGKAISYIFIPPHVLGIINYIRSRIIKRNNEAALDNQLYVSDRRWRKIIRLIRASAFLNSREEADVMDCFLIADCIWDHMEQVAEVAEMVQHAVVSHGYHALYDLSPVRQELASLLEEIDQETRQVTQETIQEKIEYPDSRSVPFYKLSEFWGKDAAYIKTSDFEKLSKDKEVFIPIHEKSYQNFRPFQAYAFTLVDENKIASKSKILEIDANEVTRDRVLAIPPSTESIAIWDKRITALIDRCDESIAIIEERKGIDQGHVRRHLFIPRENAKYVNESLAHAIDEILSLKVEIEKAKHHYGSNEQD